MDYKLPKSVISFLDTGLKYHKIGKFDEAMETYDRVLRKVPLQTDALWLKALILMEFSEFEQSIGLLRIAIKKRPTDAQIMNDLGMVYEKSGRLDLAYETFRNAYELNNDLPSVNINLSRVELDRNNYHDALEKINYALKLDNSIGEGHNIKGLILDKMHNYDNAIKSFSMGLTLNPNNLDILINKANLFCKLGLLDKALFDIEQVFKKIEPNSVHLVRALITFGLILQKSDKLSLSKKKYDEVISLDANNLEALVNRAEINKDLGDIESAYNDYNSALLINRDSAELNYNFSRLLLLNNNFAEGWPKFESRWETLDFIDKVRGRSLPKWDGKYDDKLSLLLWGEQGLGDQILFLSQLKDLLAMNIYPTIEVDARIVKIISRSFKDLDVYGYDHIPNHISDNFTAQIPIGSLGGLLCKNNNKVSRFPFINSNDLKTQEYRNKYKLIAKDKLLVGISWNSMNPQFGLKKSLPLKEWTKVLQNENTMFVSLQYGDVENEINNLNNNLYVYNDKDLDQVLDLDAALSQIDSMDLIITTSNTTAHLAGALGKKTWVMVPKVPEWRWGLSGTKSIWYESVKIFRQREIGDWEGVVKNISLELKAFSNKT